MWVVFCPGSVVEFLEPFLSLQLFHFGMEHVFFILHNFTVICVHLVACVLIRLRPGVVDKSGI